MGLSESEETGSCRNALPVRAVAMGKVHREMWPARCAICRFKESAMTTKKRPVSHGVSFALLSLTLLSTHIGRAGVDTWTSGGPDGEFVACIAVDPKSPQTLYVGTYNGVFRSTDGGTSWVRTGLENTYVYRMAIDPLRPATLYAQGRDRAFPSLLYDQTLLYKTTDGAETWRVVRSFGSSGIEGFIAIDPVNSDTVYVADPGSTRGGVLKTTNGGASWSAMNAGLPTWGVCASCPQWPQVLYSLVIDPSNPATLYSLALFAKVYRSTDGGSRWTLWNQAKNLWKSLLIDSSSTLYAVGNYGVDKLTPSLTHIYPAPVTAFSLDPSAPGTLYLATTVTTDNVTQPKQFATVILKSTNGGTSWKPLGNGLSNQYVSSMVVDAAGRSLHAGTGRDNLGALESGHGVFDFEITRPCESPVVPIVVDVRTDTAHYTTELTLTNDTSAPQTVNLVYTASFGSAEGSGTATDLLMPGEQRRIDDLVAYLRDKGLALPSRTGPAGQGGTLRVITPEFDGVGRVAALARTATTTQAPLPMGRAGLAYGSVEVFAGHAALRVFGLRSSDADRSNLAVVNTSASPMTVRITVFSGGGDGRSSVVRDAQALPPYGWVQINSPELLDQPGIANGWALVERTSDQGGLYAYGVVNDRVTNDGSFLAPTRGGTYGGPGVIPVLVETQAFSSELVLANRSDVDATITLQYVESLSPERGTGGTASLTLPARTQWIVPGAIGFLRQQGLTIGPAGGIFAGSMAVSVLSGPPADAIYAGARTATPSENGGEFGLFTPGITEMAGGVCIVEGCFTNREQPAWGTKAYIYGLVADDRNRSNVAVANAGFYPTYSSNVSLRLEVHDGDAGGALKGDPIEVTLAPGQWKQFDGILKAAGVANGWVEITETNQDEYVPSWIAYGVINDGGRSRERTGDGAYVPMTK